MVRRAGSIGTIKRQPKIHRNRRMGELQDLRPRRSILASIGSEDRHLHIDDLRTGRHVESWPIGGTFKYRCDCLLEPA